MKRIVLALTILTAVSTVSSAQSLEVYPSQINFGYVNETDGDSVRIALYNATPTAFDVEVEHSRRIYSDRAFSITPSVITVPALDSAKVWLHFHPVHNVDYSGNIVLADDGPGGATMIEVNAHGRYSNSYYGPTEGLNEEALKSALNTLLAQGFISLSYNNARDEMYGSLDNVNGEVECVYTGRKATFNDRPGANTNNFNCEHTFPQGFFSQGQPMRGDIHHLFPTDGSANSVRSNHPFGVVSNATWTNGGSKYGSSTFEPRDQHKGAAARAMMYFVIRYTDYANFFAPQESLLRQWHNTFAPTPFEKGRNDGIYLLQNNRNPFVDYPQFEERINTFIGTSSADPVFELALAHDTIFLPVSAGASHSVIFRTAVVNTGNEPVFVQPKATGHPMLTYANGTDAPETLLPGEGKVIDLEYPYGYSFDPSNGTDTILYLTTNLPGGSLEIPVRSASFDLSLNQPGQQEFSLKPNPAGDYVELPDNASDVMVSDVFGRVIYRGNDIRLSTYDWPSGVYHVRYSAGDVLRSETLVIRHWK